jgi:hypothetical protein
MSTGTKVFINCLQQKHSLCFDPDFDIICLSNTVLETAYVVFMRYKRLGGRAPDSLSPRSHKVVFFIFTPCYHAIITILSVKCAFYYIILEESVYFYNPDHVKK